MRLAIRNLAVSVRAGDWWDYKLVSIVQVFPATALALHISVFEHWPDALLLIPALATGAVFASIVNDICDLADDAAGGKPNGVARMPEGIPLAVATSAAAVGLLFAWHWRDDYLLCAIYGCAWLAFIAYSARPLRLKKRGGWGVVAMALGEATLPSIVAALLCTKAAGVRISFLWIGTISLWSFCHGSRAILWHQIGDRDADARAALDTFVRRRSVTIVKQIARRWIFPVEVVALVAILVQIGSVVPFIALAWYLTIIPLRMRYWHNVPVIVDRIQNHYLLLQDFYIAYLPFSLLITAAFIHPANALALPPFLLLFHRAPLRVVRENLCLISQIFASARARLRARQSAAN